MTKRKMHPNSLNNLWLNRTPSDNKRMNFMVSPANQELLESVSNKSELVNSALDFYARCEYGKEAAIISPQNSEDLLLLQDQVKGLRKQVCELELRNQDLVAELSREKDSQEVLFAYQDKAIALLIFALKLAANKGGAIKEKIRQAIKLLDDEWDSRETPTPEAIAKIVADDLLQ